MRNVAKYHGGRVEQYFLFLVAANMATLQSADRLSGEKQMQK